ncbi:leucine-rich repeat serine/threonine-protein kinase 1-like [Mya arenaria]|uniref:leucine-rich repeat serine/threonine-protein kinase 1-like n=1 Tax=Mya arenaria TaxID=6604 RepID=UPI0022E09D9C|nr:leucine-rich repeat serine/threonine-protein kinase 1-like [Mya arenaria]
MVDFVEDIDVLLADGDEEGILRLLERAPNIPTGFEAVSGRCKDIVSLACQSGNPALLEILLQMGVDITDSEDSNRFGVVQQACVNGKVAILDFLHSRGFSLLPVGMQPWHEESPIYLACRHGHQDVVDFLINKDLDLIKHEDVRSCLLYAACLGGNDGIVRRFLSPNMNINEPMKLVRRFTDSENKTPLHGACKGDHFNVVEFLFDTFGTEVAVTEQVGRDFPHIIGRFLSRYFVPVESASGDRDSHDDLFQLHTGHLQKRNLHFLHSDWLNPYLVTLTTLDISNNSITELPSCLPWQLQNLKVLNAANNSLRQLTWNGLEGEEPNCCSLEEVNLSNNILESVTAALFCVPSLISLNLSHNKLQYLSRSKHQHLKLEKDPTANKNKSLVELQWLCNSLKILNVSHNSLCMLPGEIQQCCRLQQLIANNNNLTTFPQPWKCPLRTLDVSENQLERFATNVETYWCCSLINLNISGNRLDFLDEGIVKLGMLLDLNASRNKIERLPGASLWECEHLHHLNLKHNHLGGSVSTPTKAKSLLSFKRTSRLGSEEFLSPEFPQCLAYCLRELRLANNNLDRVPPSICNLSSLEILDLSDNPIKDLPKELGNLRNCGLLKLKGISPKLPEHLAKHFTQDGKMTREMLTDFQDDLRGSKPCYKVKAMMIGKKDMGKTTLMNRLAGRGTLKGQNHRSIVCDEITIPAKRDFPISRRRESDVLLRVWDVPGDDVYTLVHHSMFTPHSLFILVWDFWSITEDIDKIRAWINNIQASTPYYKVVLVGTFLDRLPTDQRASAMEEVQNLMHERLKPITQNIPVLCPVSCINNEGIDKLKAELYKTCMSMHLPGRSRKPLVGRKIPHSFTLVQNALTSVAKAYKQEKKPLCLTQTEFMNVLEDLEGSDLDLSSSDDISKVTRFLVETGHLLHFPDHLGALDTLYFLDPAWLCDILLHLLISPEGKQLLKIGQGKIHREEVRKVYMNAGDQFPSKFIDQYIELLERFELAASISQTKKLFVPSQLARDPPLIESKEEVDKSKIVRRLYCMAECPSGFWTRLLTRMVTRIDQFSKEEWSFRPVCSGTLKLVGSRRSGGKEPKRGLSFSSGLHLKNPTNTFCREWMRVTHANGSFCIEPVSLSGGVDGLENGLLITEVNMQEKFGIIGVIVDEIEDIIQDYYPGLLDIDDCTMRERIERYAVCPSCYPTLPLPACLNHFTVEMCAQKMIDNQPVICPNGSSHELSHLVPDLLMQELPLHFFLDVTALETQDSLLGGGVAGAVYRGRYRGNAVAVKLYRSDARYQLAERAGQLHSNGSETSGTGTMGSNFDDGEIYANVADMIFEQTDREKEAAMKSFKALKELRQEVSLTSRLQHPCIIALVGMAFSPHLMMALELAPLGSLRSVLDREVVERPVFNKYSDRRELQKPLFHKWLIFKFVYQISKGLEYLHSHGIVYKDLKSDNILTMSLSLNSPVNVKLSDYGISRFSWGGRSVGLVGTLGYQAPEILEGVPYDEKVDIFSLSMVIYEILTGKRPFSEYENLSQITKALKLEEKRPNLQDLNVHSRFPWLEGLMQECWARQAMFRPPASTIVSRRRMQSTQFLAQTACFRLQERPFEDQCVIGASIKMSQNGRQFIWVWEGGDSEDNPRTLSVLDPGWGSVSVERNVYPGPRARCMTKVGTHIWVGNLGSEIEVFDAQMGDMEPKGVFKLDGVPIQMLAHLEGENKYAVYVAMDNGVVFEFKNSSQNSHRQVGGVSKHISGYSAPSTLTLRSHTIHSMAMCEAHKELWVSNGCYIDIIDCVHFKVNTDERISLPVLLGLCEVPKYLLVSQIVCNDVLTFCLLGSSPFVLVFQAQNHKCFAYFSFENNSLYGKQVDVLKNFSVEEHLAYKGVTAYETSNRGSSIGEESSDEEMEVKKIGQLKVRQSAFRVRLPSEPPLVPRRPPKAEDSVTGDLAPPVPPRPFPTKSPSKVDDQKKPRPPPRGPHTVTTMPGFPTRKLKALSSVSLPSFPSSEACDMTVTSIAVVKNSLWVGRNIGDICIVDIEKERSPSVLPSVFGQVVAVMYDQNKLQRSDLQVDHVGLLSLENNVVSTYRLCDGLGFNEMEIAAWENYDVHDVSRIESFWGSIAQMEKDMISKNGSEVHVGEF